MKKTRANFYARSTRLELFISLDEKSTHKRQRMLVVMVQEKLQLNENKKPSEKSNEVY